MAVVIWRLLIFDFVFMWLKKWIYKVAEFISTFDLIWCVFISKSHFCFQMYHKWRIKPVVYNGTFVWFLLTSESKIKKQLLKQISIKNVSDAVILLHVSHICHLSVLYLYHSNSCNSYSVLKQRSLRLLESLRISPQDPIHTKYFCTQYWDKKDKKILQ